MEGGSWNYANKDIYLKSLLVAHGIIVLGIMVPFVASTAWVGLAGTAIVLVLGFYNAEVIVRLFL